MEVQKIIDTNITILGFDALKLMVFLKQLLPPCGSGEVCV